MQMRLIANPDAHTAAVYKVARAVYAETGATSLPVVEAMVSTIANIAARDGRDYVEIVSDPYLFSAQNSDSPRHELMNVPANNRAFQMCVRVVQRMMRGGLADSVRGAVRFHRADEMPAWATARGYIADVDGVLFYL